MHFKRLGAFACMASVLVTAPLATAQEQASSNQTSSNQASAQPSTAEISELRSQLAEQQKQIEQLRKILEQQQRLLEAQSTPAKSPENSEGPRQQPTNLGEVASTTPVVPVAKSITQPLGAFAIPGAMKPPAAPQPGPDEAPSPLQLKVGLATITPVGFMDLTNTWRSTNSGATLATNFGNFPYNNTPQGRLTENRISAQNSRIGFRVDALFKGTHVLGYYEGDFVGGNAGANTQVTSYSMTYRLRLYWINLRRGAFEVQAGQSWSLLTPNRKGLSALPADLFYGQVVDVNYINGLTWGRIPGVRFIFHPSDKVTAGLSLENSEQYIGGSGGGGTPVLPTALQANNYNNEVNNGNTNTSVPNLHPDIIGKIAFEPTNRVHFEVAGVERTFKTFMPSTQQYFTKAGGGVSVNANLEIIKNFRLITNNFWSDGGGRYLFGLSPDLIIRADGSPSLVHSGSTVDGFEATLKNTALYGYYGGTYIGRNTARDTNNSLIGYGFTGSANSQNRSIQEVTVGLTQTLWKDAKYGAVSFMLEYAYFWRNPWFVALNAPKNAHEHAFWFNIRYTLPGSAPTIKY